MQTTDSQTLSAPTFKEGVLFVNKSIGCSSKDVSRILERKLPKKTNLKLGHIGTLDPMASGLLAIALGRATRLQNYLLEGPKEYVFTFELGYETDSLDLEGTIVKRIDASAITSDQIKNVIAQFPASYEQIPPLYSAVKYKGRSLHTWARKGQAEPVALESLKRRVHIQNLVIEDITLPSVTLRATVSKGTYVRCLARDIATNLGTYATVTKLMRTEALGIRLADSVSQSEIENGSIEDVNRFVVPIAKLQHPQLAQLIMQHPDHEIRLRSGRQVLLSRAELEESKNDANEAINTLVKKTLLLLSVDHNVFGIAQVQKTDKDDWFQVRMIRGL